MTTVYLALGSNVGNSEAYIAHAIQLLSAHLLHIKQAPLYRSKAVGYTDQPDFVNTALSGDTTLSPTELLTFIKDAERQIGRVERFRWGPREIDIDIIFYGDTLLETEALTLPHPRFRERDFVLRPLSDLNPQAEDPVTHKTVGALLDELKPSEHSIKP